MTTIVRLTSPALVGRDDPLRSSTSALRSIQRGHPGIAVVRGPAGIGKTRFVAALVDELRDGDAAVLIGGCLDLDPPVPYAPLIEAFRGVDPAPGRLLDALTAHHDLPRSQLFALLRDEVVALAQHRLTVLVVEDLQWSDRVTRDALLYLAATARHGRWALLVTLRDEEVALDPSIAQCVALLARDARVRVSLDALPPRDVAAVIEAITGAAPSQEDADRIHRRSGGVPLLVEEVLAAETAGMTAVPDHLRDLFLTRVRRLDRRAGQAVNVVAVVGGPCSARLVGEVLACEVGEADAALGRAAAANILATGTAGYRMRHELLRDAVYDDVPRSRRRALHRRAAQSLAVSDAAPAVLAHHWAAAGAPAEAARAGLDAAARAERMHAPAEAHRHLEMVLAHFDALPAADAEEFGGRGELLTRAAEAAYLGGEFDRAITLAESALAATDEPALEALRWERLARYRWVARDGAGAQRAHVRSVAVLPRDAAASVRARVLSGHGWNQAIIGRIGQAQATSQRALHAAESSDAPLERCRALLAWGLARDDGEAGLEALRRARDLAVGCDASDELARAQLAIALALRQLGRRAEREQALRDGLGHVAAHGLAGSYAPVMRYLLAELLLETGRWNEAGALLDESVHRGVSGVPAMFTHAYRAQLAAGRGDAAALDASVAQVIALSDRMPQQPMPRAIVQRARAEAALWAGEPAAALAHVERGDPPARDAMGPLASLALRARALADLSDLARQHGRQAPPMPPEVETETRGTSSQDHPRSRAIAATIAGEVSRHAGERAADPWRHAVTSWQETADPYGAAYSRLRLAHALLGRRTGRQEAGMHLQEAARAATLLGAHPLLGAATDLATAARMSVSIDGTATVQGTEGDRAVAEPAVDLTPREREILPLLAAGRTNAEIADALIISPRTVGVHVSRILAKLGASRRTEAAFIARQRGLLDD